MPSQSKASLAQCALLPCGSACPLMPDLSGPLAITVLEVVRVLPTSTPDSLSSGRTGNVRGFQPDEKVESFWKPLVAHTSVGMWPQGRPPPDCLFF